MRWTCDLPPEDLLAHAEGELQAARKEIVEAHLEVCPACKERMALYARVDRTLQEGTPLAPGGLAWKADAIARLEREAVGRAGSLPEGKLGPGGVKAMPGATRRPVVRKRASRAAGALGLGIFALTVLGISIGLALVFSHMQPDGKPAPGGDGEALSSPTAVVAHESEAATAPASTATIEGNPAPQATAARRSPTPAGTPAAVTATAWTAPEPTTMQGPGVLATPTVLPSSERCPAPRTEQLRGSGGSIPDLGIRFEDVALASDYVFLGVAGSTGPPMWNTEDGCWRDWERGGPTLHKPVEIDVETEVYDPSGTPADARYALLDERLRELNPRAWSGPPRLVPGRRYIFAGDFALDERGQDDKSLVIIQRAYEIDGQDMVRVAPDTVISLSAAVARLQARVSGVTVHTDCNGEIEFVTVTNSTDTDLTVKSIRGWHPTHTGHSHGPVRPNRVVRSGEQYTYRSTREQLDLDKDHIVYVETSVGSVKVRCNGMGSFKEGDHVDLPAPVTVTFRLAVTGEAPEGVSFEVTRRLNGSGDHLSSSLCGPARGADDADIKCEGGGKLYTAGPYSLTSLDSVEYSFRRRGDGGEEIFLGGTKRLGEDTVIEASYGYP